ncbi:unnamed protein product [Peniophora sp. CBMAI 1063]|nr:unnamed protein product [Peniophora sp. CBMAI 1063]
MMPYNGSTRFYDAAHAIRRQRAGSEAFLMGIPVPSYEQDANLSCAFVPFSNAPTVPVGPPSEFRDRAPAGKAVSSIWHRERDDPNICRYEGCKRQAMIHPRLGNMEWCSDEHMRMAITHLGLKECRTEGCVNPRRRKDKRCSDRCGG